MKTTKQVKREGLKLTPTQKRMLQLPKDILIKYNALIVNHVSMMSAAERRMVIERVEYGLSKNTISKEEVDKEIEVIRDYIEQGGKR
jgi:hypothetical protein